MRKFRLGLASVSSLVFILSVPSAMAGNCGAFGGLNCDAGVTFNSAGAPVVDPLHVNVAQPLGGLRSVHVRSAPTVSITRLYGQQQALAGIADAPSGFQGGCHPTTTQYCRQNVGAASNFAFSAPQFQAPLQVQAPLIAAPIISAPAPIITQPVTSSVQFGSGFNPAAFAPRQYGEDVFTPGIAHVPTSYVDRSPLTAERLLSSGATRSQTSFAQSIVQPSFSQSAFVAPTATSSVSHSFAAPAASGRTTAVEADGGYWEEVSGPTLLGDTLATRVICRRQAPVVQQEVEVQTQQIYTQVVRPVVAVPTPVPVQCAPAQIRSRYGFGQNIAAPQPSFNGVQGFNGFNGFHGGPIVPATFTGVGPVGFNAAPLSRWTR